uniref:Cysteine proteinase 2 n=1 Tax=Necator americanus TaxID=51031 RepID=A1YUM4_NECAM|nr:cysteine proteinase 2 [Necator americanus]
MLTLAALLISVSLVEPTGIGEFLAQPAPAYARRLTGQALVDYVNSHHSLYKAKYSPDAQERMKSRIMDLSFMVDAEVMMEEMDQQEDIDLAVSLPESFDAREKWPECPSIGLIRDQSAGGGCWAVSSAEVMTDRICIQSNGTKQVYVSETDILSCCGQRCGSGCTSGVPRQAFNYAIRKGVCSGGPYGTKGVCKPYPFYPCGYHAHLPYYGPCPDGMWPTPTCEKACQSDYTVPYNDDRIFGSKTIVLTGEEKIKREIFNNGPLVATYTVYEDFAYYKNGIYMTGLGRATGAHAVKIIGWGEENGVKYWLIANSWNTDWGENGFFRMLRGTNLCDIELSATGGTFKV